MKKQFWMAMCMGLGLALATTGAVAQEMGGAMTMKAPADKKPLSPPAKAEVTVAGAAISIDYSAPSVRGRVIFGGLVPWGQVWRTGANAATTLKASANLKIGDLAVPAGTYTLYTLPTETGWTLIVNKQTGQWGTEYDAKQDFGRVALKKSQLADKVETMVLVFEKTKGSMTELHLKWADLDLSVPVTVTK